MIPRPSLRSLLFILLSGSALAQDADLPKATVAHVQKIPNGDFLFAMRFVAPQTKVLNLSRPPVNPNGEAGSTDPRPFSLTGGESTLQDLYSGKIYPSKDQVPFEPYMGPSSILTTLSPGGKINLTVAFPPIPPPPVRDGKKQPYRLLFEVPSLKIKTKLELDSETLRARRID